MEPTEAALVLGSSQPEEHVDREASKRLGIEIARRRTGGGAVLVRDGALLWVDLLLPSGDELWQPDVGVASWWVGDAWASALRTLGLRGVTVWKEAMRSTEWSSRACFAGVGPGEVLIDGKKAVGISQRRTRSAALFQTAALLQWEPADLVRLLALDPSSRKRAEQDLAASATPVARRSAELLEAFLGALPG